MRGLRVRGALEVRGLVAVRGLLVARGLAEVLLGREAEERLARDVDEPAGDRRAAVPDEGVPEVRDAREGALVRLAMPRDYPRAP